MKVVIVGAGASYDSYYEIFDSFSNIDHLSTPDIKWKPPLGNQLFDNREVFREILFKHSGARAIAAEAKLAPDIEVFLEKIRQAAYDSKDNHLAWQLLSTQMYLQELILSVSRKYLGVGSSNYSHLISKAYRYSVITNEDVVFINFNYDLFLERALEEVALLNIKNIEDYIKHRIKIIKPHGSCNWVKRFGKFKFGVGSNISDQLHNNASDFILKSEESNWSQEITLSESTELIYREKRVPVGYVFPQLAIPLKSKTEFICPQSHIDEMNKALKDATEILIIGWKCGEVKFGEILQKNLSGRTVKVTLVDTNPRDVATNLGNLINKNQIEFFGKDWKEEMDDNLGYETIHGGGSFSSYSRNVAAGRYEDFFGINLK